MYGKSKNSAVPSDSQAREKYVLFYCDAFFHDETKSTKLKINNQSAKTKRKFIKNHISTENIIT